MTRLALLLLALLSGPPYDAAHCRLSKYRPNGAQVTEWICDAGVMETKPIPIVEDCRTEPRWTGAMWHMERVCR